MLPSSVAWPAEFLKQNRVLTVDYLMRHFGVSAQTMRRDLKFLAERGLHERAHGGASPAPLKATDAKPRFGRPLRSMLRVLVVRCD